MSVLIYSQKQNAALHPCRLDKLSLPRFGGTSERGRWVVCCVVVDVYSMGPVVWWSACQDFLLLYSAAGAVLSTAVGRGQPGCNSMQLPLVAGNNRNRRKDSWKHAIRHRTSGYPRT